MTRFDRHDYDQPPDSPLVRWQIKCINAGQPAYVPHAMTYRLRPDRTLVAPVTYHATRADAVRYVGAAVES